MIELLEFKDLNSIKFEAYRSPVDGFLYLAVKTKSGLELITSDEFTVSKSLVKIDNIIYQITVYGYLFKIEPI